MRFLRLERGAGENREFVCPRVESEVCIWASQGEANRYGLEIGGGMYVKDHLFGKIEY